MNNILVTVDKPLVQEQIKKLNGYLSSADAVTADSTFSEISRAQNTLFMARGVFSVLWNFKLLSDWLGLEERMNSIEAKHQELWELKLKNSRPAWKC